MGRQMEVARAKLDEGSRTDGGRCAGIGELRFRPMRTLDLDRIMAIEQVIYPFPWTRANFADSLQAGHEGWVLEAPPRMNSQRDAGPIGYAMLMWAVDEVHLLNLSIALDRQGQGLGRGWLESLCARCVQLGAKSMLLEVRPSNSRAISLYESAGFERIGLRRGYYPSFEGQREDAIVMRRILTAQGTAQDDQPEPP